MILRILAIGNSFSQDATARLRPLCAAGGRPVEAVNLYIGGCELKRHWENMQADRDDYEIQIDGLSTGQKTSIRAALGSGDWDVVTLQQASHDSGRPETYFPYLALLSEQVGRLCPGARQWLHETWAYETTSTHPGFAHYNRDQAVMYAALKGCYEDAARRLGLPMLPCGDVIQRLRATPTFDFAAGGPSLCRDGFHLELCYARFAAAAVWYEMLTDGDIRENGYCPDAQAAPDPVKLTLIRQIVHAVCMQQKEKQL